MGLAASVGITPDSILAKVESVTGLNVADALAIAKKAGVDVNDLAGLAKKSGVDLAAIADKAKLAGLDTKTLAGISSLSVTKLASLAGGDVSWASKLASVTGFDGTAASGLAIGMGLAASVGITPDSILAKVESVTGLNVAAVTSALDATHSSSSTSRVARKSSMSTEES